MTEAEARKIRSAFSNGYHFPFGGGFEKNCNMNEVNRHAELLDEAITKQIPMPPKKDRTPLSPRYTDAYTCPKCGKGFTGTGFADYCYHCGQALDWGDVI